MKRKITYILKDIDILMKLLLQNSTDFQSQIKLVKERNNIIKDIQKIIKKYEKIINEK